MDPIGKQPARHTATTHRPHSSSLGTSSRAVNRLNTPNKTQVSVTNPAMPVSSSIPSSYYSAQAQKPQDPPSKHIIQPPGHQGPLQPLPKLPRCQSRNVIAL